MARNKAARTTAPFDTRDALRAIRVIGMAVGAFLAFILTFLLFSQVILPPMALKFHELYGQDLKASEAGEFFNFTLGLPVAASGAIFGALTTLAAGLFALRQGDVDILSFVESNTSPAIRHYRDLVSAIGRLNACGNEAREIGAILYKMIEKEGGPNSSPLVQNVLEATDHFSSVEEALEFLSGIENLEYKNVLASLFLHAAFIKENLTEVAALFEEIEKNFYASYFSRRQAEAHLERRPLRYLKDVTPPEQFEEADFLDDLPSLAERLRTRAWQRDLFALARASAYAPPGISTIHYLGLVLEPAFLPLQSPLPFDHPDQSGVIHGYVINFGAAQLLAIANTIPEKKTIENVVLEIFPSRSRIARKFLQKLLPERKMLGPPYILDSIEPEFSVFRNLILVDVSIRGYRKIVFYNAKIHGPLPPVGYQSDDESVRIEQLRHKEKGAALASRALLNSSLRRP